MHVQRLYRLGHVYDLRFTGRGVISNLYDVVQGNNTNHIRLSGFSSTLMDSDRLVFFADVRCSIAIRRYNTFVKVFRKPGRISTGSRTGSLNETSHPVSKKFGDLIIEVRAKNKPFLCWARQSVHLAISWALRNVVYGNYMRTLQTNIQIILPAF